MARRFIKVVSDGTALGTHFLDEVTGTEIRGIARASLDFRPREPVEADLHLFLVATEAKARARFLLTDPKTGQVREVVRIVWADGGQTDLD